MLHLLTIAALAIIHGEPADETDYPMAGAVLIAGVVRVNPAIEYPFSVFICSGTLIAPDVVLTAAHCLGVEDIEEAVGYPVEDPYMVFLRDVDVRDYEAWDDTPRWPRDAGLASSWVAHPDYDPGAFMYSSLWQNDDIGLIWLDEPIEGELSYLPTAEEGALLREGTAVEVVGWGRRTAESGGPSGVKYLGETTISRTKSWAMQVGEYEEDVRKCHGDSGGPSYARFDTVAATDLRQVGVTSHAYDATDCEETGGVDTRVDFYLEWIDATLEAACADGTRSWCDVPGIPEAPLPGEEPPSFERPGVCQTGSGQVPTALVLLIPILARRRRRDRESPRR